MILAVDGGNSKTDLALIDSDGGVLAHARGPLSSPHHLGLDGCLEVLQRLVAEIGLDGRTAEVANVLLAGIDFPEEEAELQAALDARAWAVTTYVGNDTFAVLRAGTEQGWGVAIGATTGDWGGGYDVGEAGLSAAARSADGRGPATVLEQLIPASFGLATPLEVAYQIHRGVIETRRLVNLAPVVLQAAATDAVAASIRDRLVDEILALVRATVTRLGLEREPVDVVVGGGLMRAADAELLGRIETGLHGIGAKLVLRRTTLPPIVGAALLGLDAVGAGPEAQARVRSELVAAVERVEQKAEAV
jgi:N-acetylglucosamine kinase-like BadF-type ATPase